MKPILLLLLSVLLVSVAPGQVPGRIQKKILKLAPEADANKDGQLSIEEMRSYQNQLPDDLRVMLDATLKAQGMTSGDSQVDDLEAGDLQLGDLQAGTPQGGKPELVKAEVPERKGPTPFLDPLFQHTVTKDIQYVTAKSGDTEMPLLLDLYCPTASADLPKKLPSMIFLFGGGWIKGSKNIKYIRDLCDYYAARGYVAISIQYRILKDNPAAVAGPAPKPETNQQSRLMNAAIQDTANAVRWVRANADKYKIDPDRIAIGGVSAGAFNSLYTGLCDESIVGPDAQVAAVISLMGAMEAKYIDKDDPPLFVAHGTADNVAPFAFVQRMVLRLKEVDAKYAFYPVEGVAHRLQTILDTPFDGMPVRDHTLDFLFTSMKLSQLLNEKSKSQ